MWSFILSSVSMHGNKFLQAKEQSKPVIIRIHYTAGSDVVNALLEIGEA